MKTINKMILTVAFATAFSFSTTMASGQNYAGERKAGYEQTVKELGSYSRTEFASVIKERIFRSWNEWAPDYAGWVAWSDGLYAPDATINAIGPKTQPFKEYQKSMKVQRDMFTMDMGPIDFCVAEDDTVVIRYEMYLTAKADAGDFKKGHTYVTTVIEFNRFAYVNGMERDPMVVHLDLYTMGLHE